MGRNAFGLLVVTALGVWAAQPVRARHGMVVTRERHATEVGLKILASGGNVVDAAVAVGFALAVTHPLAGNIGGGGFLLVRLADGRSSMIDFRERAPAAASARMYLDAAGKVSEDSIVGYRASAVPGTVRGFEHAWRKYGKKPWAELVRPAVELASQGFAVSYAMAQSLRSPARGLSRFAETRRIFLRNGRYYEPGETFVQPELAQTLQRMARWGAQDFYEGETARRLAQDMREHGGTITLDDLKNYTVVERQPLRGAYRGYTLLTAPPPSAGGVGLLQMLALLEGTGFERSGPGSARAVHYMVEAMRRCFADRAKHLGDPDFVKVPVRALLDPHYILRLRRAIDPERATPSRQVQAGVFSENESAETTHYTIADREGNIAAVSYTLNSGYGSRVTAAGLGFLLNNNMGNFAAQPGEGNLLQGLVQGEANVIRAHKRPLASMAPTILLRDGKPYLALGTPGGPTIVNTLLEVIVNVIDFDMNVQDAVNWPRFHHQWMPDQVWMEAGYSPDTVALLEKRGHTVKREAAPGQGDGGQGEVAAIRFDQGWLEGAPDPRCECTAAGHRAACSSSPFSRLRNLAARAPSTRR